MPWNWGLRVVALVVAALWHHGARRDGGLHAKLPVVKRRD